MPPDFEDFDQPYRRRQGLIDHEEHNRTRVRQILANHGQALGFGQDGPAGGPANSEASGPSGRVPAAEGETRPPYDFEPVGDAILTDDRGNRIKHTVRRCVGHPRFEHVIVSGAGEDYELWVIDGMSWPTRGAAEARLKVVEDVGRFCLGSPAWDALRRDGRIADFRPPPSAISAGDDEGRDD